MQTSNSKNPSQYHLSLCCLLHLIDHLQVMKVILSALQTVPADLPQQAGNNSSSSSIGGKVNPAVAATAHSAMERVFDHCQQVPARLLWAHIHALLVRLKLDTAVSPLAQLGMDTGSSVNPRLTISTCDLVYIYIPDCIHSCLHLFMQPCECMLSSSGQMSMNIRSFWLGLL